MNAEPDLRDRVRGEVLSVLVRSPAYRELPEDVGAQLADDMTRVGELLADKAWLTHPFPAVAGAPADRQPDAVRERLDALRELVKAVDFPDFVAKLVQGVFGAIVDSSIKQMEAYAELLAAAAKTVDQFAKDTTSEAAKRELATQRQQQLATMVLMGINRIVVT